VSATQGVLNFLWPMPAHPARSDLAHFMQRVAQGGSGYSQFAQINYAN